MCTKRVRGEVKQDSTLRSMWSGVWYVMDKVDAELCPLAVLAPMKAFNTSTLSLVARDLSLEGR